LNHHCKICGSQTREIVIETLGAAYYYCEACEFIAKDENLKLSHEEELGIYETHENSIEDPRYVAYFKKFLDAAVFNHYPKPGYGLDFGSGPSPVLATLLERDYGLTMDIYDHFYSPQKVYVGKKYDLVTSTEVVEHLDDPLAYFSLFESLLKDEGILSIMTLFHHNDNNAFRTWHYVRDQSHRSFYTVKTLEVIAEKTGLELIDTNHHRYSTFRKS
jgi:hypothetical protein